MLALCVTAVKFGRMSRKQREKVADEASIYQLKREGDLERGDDNRDDEEDEESSGGEGIIMVVPDNNNVYVFI